MSAVTTQSLIIIAIMFIGMFTGGSLLRLMGFFLKAKGDYLQIFCGGLLAGLLAFDLLPEAIHHYHLIGIFSGISMGLLIMMGIEFFFHQSHLPHVQNEETVVLLLVAFFIHSIPTGVSLGISLQTGTLSNSLLMAILIHHIPEGLILMTAVLNKKRAFAVFILLISLVAILMGVNAYMGLTMQIESPKWNTIFLGMALGTLGYVTFYELIWKQSKLLSKGKLLFFVLLGLLVMNIFLKLISSSH